MSLFRSRKKSFSEAETSRRPSMDDAPPLPTGLGKYSFKRKKEKQEVKKEINIATALPSRDDFRTSLLMPNLSARFSMLREQDDPSTKVGKASDDSVLFPKRASRLNLFMNVDLTDIAEVSSLSGSIRPPFTMERSSTYSSNDGYGTDDDRSVMTRARPGQGNKFFGGRQKIYMLSTKEGEGGSSRSRGRAVYDDDINLSAFKPSAEEKRTSDDHDDFDPDYNSKRETSSSTNSGPLDGRTSTAATSVASASPATTNNGFANKLTSFSTNNADRSVKGKRLYGQGIDQHILDQQSSALNRLNSVQRNFGPGMVHYGSGPTIRSNTNVSPSSAKAVQNTAPVLPPVVQSNTSSLGGFEFATAQDMPRDVTNRPFGVSATSMSPPMSPADPTLVAALDANDIGKATATGAFNKPAGPYNDEQFAQRQLQLQQGRETPPSRAFSRASSNNTTNPPVSRGRNDSHASQRSAFSYESSQARTQPSIGEQTSLPQLRASNTLSTKEQQSTTSFQADDSASEYESDSESHPASAPQTVAQAALSGSLDIHRKYEHDDQHPAFSSQMASQEDLSIDNTSNTGVESQTVSNRPSTHSLTPEVLQEPSNPGGLSDMVRGHLRNISNQSSIYPDSPGFSKFGELPEFPPELAHQATMPVKSVPSPITAPPDPPENALAVRARLLRENANQLKNASAKLSEESAQESARSRRDDDSSSPDIPWQEQLKMHQRQGSTETQREREDFANELADRRKQVQNKLRDLNNRSNDPSPSRSSPLGLLKKPSLGSLANRGDNTPKGMKQSDSQSSLNNYDARYRSRSNSRSAENLSRFGGAALRDRMPSLDSRQNFLWKSSDPAGRGMERSPPAMSMSPTLNGYGFPYKPEEPRGQYHPAGRARKYSPPSASRSAEPGKAPYVRSTSASGQDRSQPHRAGSSNGSHYTQSDAYQQDSHSATGMSPPQRQYTSPPDIPWLNSVASRNGSAPNLTLQTPRKGSISKAEISGPSLISGNLSMSNGNNDGYRNESVATGPHVPPLPPINPRRRGQNFFSPFGGRSGHDGSTVSTPTSAVTSPLERDGFMTEEPEEMASSPPAESESRSRFRTRLRKTSSAGDNMSHRARHQALKDLDRMPATNGIAGGMF